MKIWAMIVKNNKIVEDLIIADQQSAVEALIFRACEQFDIGKPLILSKNESEIRDFRRTVFFPSDFVEPVIFDTYVIELIDEEENKNGKVEEL